MNKIPLPDGIATFAEFWPYYVREHLNVYTRIWHVSGTLLGTALLLSTLWGGIWLWVWVGPALGYACSWIGHFFVERNKPATFKYFWYSLGADYVMMWKEFRGEMRMEVDKALGLRLSEDE